MKIATKLELLQEVINNKFYPQVWRFGQAVFNTACKLFPAEAEYLRSSHVDCFFNDERVQEFIEALEKLVIENNTEYHLINTEIRLPTIEDKYFIIDKDNNKSAVWFNTKLQRFQRCVPDEEQTEIMLFYATMLLDKDEVQFWLEKFDYNND